MIVSNLAVLLAERGLKITQVSKDTGISRTTLTALTQGNAQGIQLDTMSTLCTYLQATPNDIFLSLPIEFCISSVWTEFRDCFIDGTPKDPSSIIGGFLIELGDRNVLTRAQILFDGVVVDLIADGRKTLNCTVRVDDSEDARLVGKRFMQLPIVFRRSVMKKIEYGVKAEACTPVDFVIIGEQLERCFSHLESGSEV